MLSILIFLTILLDYLLTYFYPSYFSHIHLFYPMLTIVLIIFLYKKMNDKKYLKTVIIIGFIYDLLFSYLFLYHTLMFLLFAKIMKKMNRYIRYNIVTDVFFLLFFIFFYDFILFMLVNMTYYSQVGLNTLFNKFENSLLLNILFLILLEALFNHKMTISTNKKNKKNKYS